MADIEWGQPPADAFISGSGKKPGHYQGFAQALKQRPGEWARLAGDDRTPGTAKNLANGIRGGKVKGFDAHMYEVAIDGGDLWVRYLGAGGDAGDDQHDRPMAPRIRAWAAAEGIDVPDKGRLPQSLVRAYIAAMEAEGIYVPLRVVGSGD